MTLPPSLEPGLHGSAPQLFAPDGEWDELLANSQADTVFLSAGWMRACLKSLPSSITVLLPCIRRDDRLVAATAFVVRGKVAEFLGTGPCDYMDLIISQDLSPSDAPACRRTLFDLAKRHCPSLRAFHLRNVPAASVTARQLAETGLYRTILREMPAPAMAMSEADEALKKKSMRRHFNKLDKQGDLRCVTTDDPAIVQPLLDAFFAQHIARWDGSSSPSLFLVEENRNLYRNLVDELGKAGTLRFTEIRLDGVLVAAHLGTMYRGVFTWYKPTYDPQLAKLSPGEVLLKTLIEQAQSENAQEFDFTIGDEAFKHRFASVTRTVMDLHVTHSSRIAAAVRLKLAGKRALRQALSAAGVWERLKRLSGRQ